MTNRKKIDEVGTSTNVLIVDDMQEYDRRQWWDKHTARCRGLINIYLSINDYLQPRKERNNIKAKEEFLCLEVKVINKEGKNSNVVSNIKIVK